MVKFEKCAKKLNTEEGATLVELLAAIAILAIVVTSFLGFFVQAGRTNNVTNEINEATFLAQEEMERVTYLSSINELNSGEFIDNSHEKFNIVTNIYESEISNTQIKMYKAIVKVQDKNETNRAQMETWLPLNNDNGETDE